MIQTRSSNVRAILVHPKYANSPHPYPPLGLAYVAASAERAGHKVRVVDMGAVRRGTTDDELVDHVRRVRPDVVGIYNNIALYRSVYRLLPKLRPYTRLLVAGGPQATLLPEESIENGFDVAVRGEGDLTFAELLDSLDDGRPLEGILGISYRGRDGAFHNNDFRPDVRDLDALPYPAYHCFDLERYYGGDGSAMPEGRVLTSRDCPAKCTFCYLKAVPSEFRLREPEKVLEEILWLRKTYGTWKIDFADDTFPSTHERIDRLLDLIIEANLGLTWSCTTRIDAVSRPVLEKMKRAGCWFIAFGVESGDDQSLKRLGKKLTTQMAYETLRDAKEIGIHTRANFMFGYPWETPETIDATLNFMRRLEDKVDYFMPQGLFHPLPGTALFNKYREQFDLDQWWMRKESFIRYLDEDEQPYFRRAGYDDYGRTDFFHLSESVIRRIRKGINLIAHHNLGTFRSKPKKWGYVGLYHLSKELYRVDPHLERRAMRALIAAHGKAKGLYGAGRARARAAVEATRGRINAVVRSASRARA
ncbi:MAG: cobalamin B12-binding domain-containing protein [Planctomycetes bacterium]|nr:cobalamin B12-binding domain-containing protein [Planctomycetota bacterium]MBI3848180.1 cobalamin B12-binding domain-containing protein [Planctomycetota bacterium]